jgi:ornithine carbamoyltransferase
MTDLEHPCQILADLQTIYENFNTLEGLKIAYVGDASANVIYSLALASDILGMELHIAAPKEFAMSSEITQKVPHVKHFNDPVQAVRGAQVVVTDTWISMGKEAESSQRLKKLAPYQVTTSLMAHADPQAIFLHCLPAYRGKEVTAEVIDGAQSRVFQEAENRLHAQKAVLMELLS